MTTPQQVPQQAPSILVTYATRYGSTTEVATTIAETLRTHGFAVDLQPMAAVNSLDGVQAVICGAPLYIGKWPKEAQDFLKRHQEKLMQRPLAIFTLGPISQEQKEREDVRSQLEQQVAKYPWLKPVALELFGGKYEPAALHFPDSLLLLIPGTPLHDLPASDVRDRSAIHAWAESLVPLLQAAIAGELQPA